MHKSSPWIDKNFFKQHGCRSNEGFEKVLDIHGVGYRAAKQGKKLVLSLGYSHPVELDEPEGITVEVPAPNQIIVRGTDKQAVGSLLQIRSKSQRFIKAKVQYDNEVIRSKEGKTGK